MIGSTECFKIRLTSCEPDIRFQPWVCIGNPPILEIICDKGFFRSNPIIILADPFLFVRNEELYLFYEEKRLFSPGVLKMIKTKDLVSWSKPITVLKETFHLSYPFVFERDGAVYMIPETSEAREVRLYKAIDNELTRFELKSVLLKHDRNEKKAIIDYSDSSVWQQDGVFYLMTTINMEGVNELLLFVSNHLEGPYIKHPMSPICKSQKYGRNAGNLLQWNSDLFRFSQDCTVRYGDNVSVFKVDVITPTKYEEHMEIDNILVPDDSFYKKGGHQLNYVRFKNKTIIATDAKEYRFFLAHLAHKLKSRS